MNQILINATHTEEVRVAVVKNKKLFNLDIESALNQKTKGNIYLGKVSRIENSLEAAFINYGKDKQGFLPLKEISELYYTADSQDKPTIAKILKEGQEIIVQIEKEERGNKGAALTTFINLVGTYMIYMPTKNSGINISRQVHSQDKKELQEVIKTLDVNKNSGVILRTVAAGKSKEELQWEIDYLEGLWNSILSNDRKPSPYLIYQESNIVIRSIRDYLRSDIDDIIIDDVKTFEQAKEFITYMLPHYLPKIKFYDNSEQSIFNHIGIEQQVLNVFKREVSLPSGATVVFDPTEALTSVDINSARANKGSNIEETAYNTNIEAAKEIANQLKLRDIGGLVVIDFIDMLVAQHQKDVEKTLEKSLEKDRARTHVGKISSFGLMEMSRQRIASTVSESVHQTCSKCDGTGVTPTVPGLAVQILRKLEANCSHTNKTHEVTIISSIEVITYLLNEKRQYIIALELKHGVKIVLLPHSYKEFPFYEIKKKTKPESSGASFKAIPKKDISPNILMAKPVTEVAELDMYLPNSPIPTKEKPFLERLMESVFGKKKPNKNNNSNKNQGKGRKNKNNRSKKKPNKNNNKNPNQQNGQNGQNKKPKQNQEKRPQKQRNQNQNPNQNKTQEQKKNPNNKPKPVNPNQTNKTNTKNPEAQKTETQKTKAPKATNPKPETVKTDV